MGSDGLSCDGECLSGIASGSADGLLGTKSLSNVDGASMQLEACFSSVHDSSCTEGMPRSDDGMLTKPARPDIEGAWPSDTMTGWACLGDTGSVCTTAAAGG